MSGAGTQASLLPCRRKSITNSLFCLEGAPWVVGLFILVSVHDTGIQKCQDASCCPASLLSPVICLALSAVISLACIPVSILWFHCLINLFAFVRSCVLNFGLDKMRTLVISDPSPTYSVTGIHILFVSHTNTSTLPDLVTEQAHTLPEVPVSTRVSLPYNHLFFKSRSS